MTIRTNWFPMDGKLGVNLNTLTTSLSPGQNPVPPEVPGPPINLGERVQGNNGSEWVYVVASATVTAFNMIGINSVFGATNLTTATVVSNVYAFGVAEFQGISTDGASLLNAQPGDFFWAMIRCAQGGRVNAHVSNSVAPGAALYLSGNQGGEVTASAGSSGGGRLNGMFAIAGGSASSGGVFPLEFGTFGYIMPGGLVSAGLASA